MARTGKILDSGDSFPSLTLKTIDGGSIQTENPEGKILVSVYSSGAIGRLNWQDVVPLVQYVIGAQAKK